MLMELHTGAAGEQRGPASSQVTMKLPGGGGEEGAHLRTGEELVQALCDPKALGHLATGLLGSWGFNALG